MLFSTCILLWIAQVIVGKLHEIHDKNELKKALASHSNILISFLENDSLDESNLSLLKEVAVKSNKLAKVLTINCGQYKKLCKQYKVVNPKPIVLQHFHKGKFNKVYDRKMKSQSILRFLEDPIGDIAWEEDDNAKDIIHAKGSQDLQKLVAKFKTNVPPMMLMFYAPWCGYCKQMKPEFAAAATMLKGKTIFIGINGDLSTTDDLKQAFNITGYPSVFLIQDGNKVYKYENENSKEALVKFVQNPTKPVPPKDIPWSEETNEIDFLTDVNFEDYIQKHDSVLVMFYAPWCGHCKSMKPELIEAAVQLKRLKIEGRIAAVDSTEQKNLSETFNIKGFPTVKYFKDGKFLFDVNERSSEGVVKFMKDPKKPIETLAEIPWKEESSIVLHPTADDFRTVLKRFKHSLVMFYAPWCFHCKTTKPIFSAAAARMQGNPKVAFIATDCTDPSYTSICSSEGVTGFPTLRYFNYGKNTSYSQYTLEREEEDFVAFMTNPSQPKLDARRHWRQIPGNEVVTILETTNFKQNIVDKKGGALVMFYSPWCGHCVAMKPVFVGAAKKIHEFASSCLIGAVDATVETTLAAQYKITGFPTILYFSPAGDWMQYDGKRTEDDIVEFVQKQVEKVLEDDRRLKEEIELKETKKMLKKEKEKDVEEKRLKEEKERKESESKRLKEKQTEEKRLKEEKESESKRLKEKQSEDKRLKEEKESESKRLKEKQAEDKRLKEEKESESKRLKEKQTEDKRLKEESESKRLKEKQAEEKRLKEEKESESKRLKEKQDEEKIDNDKEFALLSDWNTFNDLVLKSPKTVVIYTHKDNRKATVRTKLRKLLNKPNSGILGYEVDCVLVPSICNRLNVIDVPAVVVFRNGVSAGSLTGNWATDSFNQLLELSSRDEL